MPANDDQPPKPPSISVGEVLPPEEEEPRQRTGRKRKRKRATAEEEEEELSEAAVFAEILSKGERSTDLIKEQTEANSKTIRSQQSFIFALKGLLKDREERIRGLEEALTASQNGYLELISKVATLMIEKATVEAAAAGSSKTKEALDIISVVLQTDLGQAVSRIATSHLGKLEAKPGEKAKGLPAKAERKEIEE